MPKMTDAASETGSERSERIKNEVRNSAWKKPPRRIESAECITCDSCVRSCPAEFGAIFDSGLRVVIVPELCSGCPKCVAVCPVDCIYVDDEYQSTGHDIWDLVRSNEQIPR